MDVKMSDDHSCCWSILGTCAFLGRPYSLSSSAGSWQRMLLLRVRLLRIELNQEANPVDLLSFDFALLARHRSCTSPISTDHFEATSTDMNLNTHIRCYPSSLMKLIRIRFCSKETLQFMIGTRSLIGLSPCLSIWRSTERGRKCLEQKMVNFLSQMTSIRSLQSNPVSLYLQSPTQQTKCLRIESCWVRMLFCNTSQLSYFLLLIIKITHQRYDQTYFIQTI